MLSDAFLLGHKRSYFVLLRTGLRRARILLPSDGLDGHHS